MHAPFNRWAAGLSITLFLLFTITLAAPYNGRINNRREIVAASSSLACASGWQAATAYNGGAVVSQKNVNYVANWWTQGNDPSTSNGASGSGQPWTINGSCAGTSTKTTSATSTTSVKSTKTTAKPTSTATSAPKPPIGSGSGVFFSPYKDVTINANWNTNVMSTKVTGSLLPVVAAIPNLPALTWSFATGECGSENWGGISAASFAAANVANFSSAGIKYVVSTGGAGGTFTCGSDAGFSTFIDRYYSTSLAGIDFDIEAGQSQADIDNLVARVKTAQGNSKYASLRFSFTIATLGGNTQQSLGTMGQMVMKSIQNGGLTEYYINLMTMDYGGASAANCMLDPSASTPTCEMGASATQAAENLKKQYTVPYSQIELTPMIGGNDSPGETFTLGDVGTVTAYALSNGLGGLHFWSLDRDDDCAPGYASPTCNSYGKAGSLGFLDAFVKAL